MANDKSFKVKNGLLAGRYLQSNGVETAGSNVYDLAGASYDSVSFSVAAQEGYPTSIRFNSNGTKMFVFGNTESVYQYSLSTAFDISTASYDSVSFSVTSQDADPIDIVFNADGTKMYMVGFQTDRVYQYSLSTAFDLSTASYDSVNFSVGTQDSNPRAIAFNGDGSKLYFAGVNSDAVYQYSLSTAFDLSTTSYDSVSLSVATEDTNVFSLLFNGDGSRFYILGTSDSVHQYSLTTSYDLSTASYDNVSFSVTSQDTVPLGMSFNNTGTKLYISGHIGDSIYQYSTVSYTQTLDLSTGTSFSFTPSGATTVSFTNPPASGLAIGFAVEINGDGSAITWPSSVKWPSGTAPTATASKELYTFITVDGGTTYYGKLAGSNIA